MPTLSSIDDLNLYLKKAEKLKTTGTVAATVGSELAVGGSIIYALSWGNYGGGTAIAGLAVTAIGVPILIKGSQRADKVKKTIDARAIQNLHISDGAGNNNKQLQNDLNQSLKKASNLKKLERL